MKSPPPHISVLVTSYNHAEYVVEALESIRAQTLSTTEVIVVDDGSRDGSAQTIAEWVHGAPEVNVKFIQQENSGQAAALNRAYAEAQGTLLALMDGDDTWHPTKLEKMAAFVAAFPDGGVYQHQMDNGFGQPMRPLLCSGDVFGAWAGMGTVNLITHAHLVKLNMPTSGLLFRREVLDTIMPVPEELVVFPDFHLFALGCTLGPLYSYPEVLGLWRHHLGNAGLNQSFAFKKFWPKVLLPAVNRVLAERGHSVAFEWRRSAIFFEPLRHLREAWSRRKLQQQGYRL